MIDDNIMLSPELLKAIAPGVGSKAQLKFDDYGTLHIIDRNEDGSIRKDYYAEKIIETESYSYLSKKEELSKVREKKNYYRTIYIFVLILLGLLTFSAVYFIYLLRY